ncbi:hypothetical protein HDV05_003289 [Chytridiales sp. JEL 0842]|nr:hypothetical protein HDV05_003289 [Chytridiales sp. JEL 0842]
MVFKNIFRKASKRSMRSDSQQDDNQHADPSSTQSPPRIQDHEQFVSRLDPKAYLSTQDPSATSSSSRTTTETSPLGELSLLDDILGSLGSSSSVAGLNLGANAGESSITTAPPAPPSSGSAAAAVRERRPLPQVSSNPPPSGRPSKSSPHNQGPSSPISSNPAPLPRSRVPGPAAAPSHKPSQQLPPPTSNNNKITNMNHRQSLPPPIVNNKPLRHSQSTLDIRTAHSAPSTPEPTSQRAQPKRSVSAMNLRELEEDLEARPASRFNRAQKQRGGFLAMMMGLDEEPSSSSSLKKKKGGKGGGSRMREVSSSRSGSSGSPEESETTSSSEDAEDNVALAHRLNRQQSAENFHRPRNGHPTAAAPFAVAMKRQKSFTASPTSVVDSPNLTRQKSVSALNPTTLYKERIAADVSVKPTPTKSSETAFNAFLNTNTPTAPDEELHPPASSSSSSSSSSALGYHQMPTTGVPFQLPPAGQGYASIPAAAPLPLPAAMASGVGPTAAGVGVAPQPNVVMYQAYAVMIAQQQQAMMAALMAAQQQQQMQAMQQGLAKKASKRKGKKKSGGLKEGEGGKETEVGVGKEGEGGKEAEDVKEE